MENEFIEDIQLEFVENIQLEFIDAKDPNYKVHIYDEQGKIDRRHSTLCVIPIGEINKHLISRDLHLINTSKFEEFTESGIKYTRVPDGKYHAMVVRASECIAYVKFPMCWICMKNDKTAYSAIEKFKHIM